MKRCGLSMRLLTGHNNLQCALHKKEQKRSLHVENNAWYLEGSEQILDMVRMYGSNEGVGGC